MTMRKPPGKRLASLLLTLSMLFTFVPALNTPARAAEPEATGSGTAGDPYVVYTYDQLWNAMDYRGDAVAGKEYIKLGCDIDTSTENGGYGLRADKAIQMHTYKLHLDLNGHTLTVKSSDSSFQDFIRMTGNMTIDDSTHTRTGKIRLDHERTGDRQLIRVVGGCTLILTNGVTLEVNATSHGACINAVLWLGGNAHANIIDANLLHVGDRSGETSNPRNWATGVLVEDSATLTINKGEFTRVVVNKPPVAGGDENPSVVINGGTFRRPLAICVGNTLDKTGPLTLPVRINGGVFNRIDEPRDYYKRDGEEQFYIYMNVGSEGKFLHFENEEQSTQWEAEVSDCMKRMQCSIFPKDAVIRPDEGFDIYQSGGSVLDIGDLSFTHIFRNVWLFTSLRDVELSGGETVYSYLDKIEVYSGLFDVKAEYGGENVPAETFDAPFVTDLTENNKLEVTWNTKLPDGLPTDNIYGYKIRMYYASTTETERELIGTDNGDGTRTATITLPDVASGKTYNIYLLPTLCHARSGEPAASLMKTLYLKSLNTTRLGGGTLIPFTLSSMPSAGDTVGPEIKLRPDGAGGVEISQSYSPWKFFEEDLNEVDVSPENPIPVNADCEKTVTLNALPGYKFENGVQASLSYGGTTLQTVRMQVSGDGKTAWATFKDIKSTAEYTELKLTVPSMKVGNPLPFDKSAFSGLPKGVHVSSVSTWKEKSAEGNEYIYYGNSSGMYAFRRGWSYQCEIGISTDSGVTVPMSAAVTINGKPAQRSATDDGFFLTSDWLTVPDPRTPIDGLTLLLEDELSSYTADTNLLIPVAAEVTQTKSEWYDSTGTTKVASGEKLEFETEYIYRATYVAKRDYRLEPDGFTVKLYGDGQLGSDQFTVHTTGYTYVTVEYHFTTPKWSGAAIYGGVTSYGSADDPVHVTLMREGQTEPVQELTLDLPTGTAPYRQEYILTGIFPGTYTLTVEKEGHVPHVTHITYPEGVQFDLAERVELHLVGSANVRGQIVGYGGKAYSVKLTPQVTDNGQRVRHLGFAGDQKDGLMTGEFVVDYVAPGVYDLVVYKPGHLDYTIKGVVVQNGVEVDLTKMTGKPYQTITLLAGDVNGDGSINESDVSVIRQAGNINKPASDAGNPETDVNGDGSVNESDVSVVRQAAHINKGTADCTHNFKED